MKNKLKKISLKNIFFFIGIGFFFYLINNLGWDVLAKQLSDINFRFIPILLIALCWHMSHTFAWGIILHGFGHKTSFLNIFRLKIISEAVNMVAPAANIGGDSVRAFMMKSEIPLDEGIPGVMIDKTIDYIARMLFIAAGLIITIAYIDIPRDWITASIICLATIFISNTILVMVQIKGLSGPLIKFSRIIPPLKRFLESKKDKLGSVDSNVKNFYTTKKGRIALATLFHIGGRILGVWEIYYILNLLNIPVSFLDSFFIASIANIVQSMFFLIPGQWGVSESVQGMLLDILGFTTSAGISLGIIRRIRRIFYMGLGMIFLRVEKKKEN